MLFGGWESATRGAGVTLQLVGELLGITDQFQGVDQINLRDDGSFEVLERVEGGKHQVSVCTGPPAVLGWATGNLAEPRNNPQIGMANMRTIMPALQKAKPANLDPNTLSYVSVSLPKQQRTTRVVKDLSPDRSPPNSVEWIGAEVTMESILVLTHADESGSALTKASLEAVTAGLELAARLAAPLTIGIVAVDAQTASKALPSTARILAVSGEPYAQPRYATDAAACAALCRAAKPTIVLAPASSRFTRVMASVAHRLGGLIDTHISSLQVEPSRDRRHPSDPLVLPPAH